MSKPYDATTRYLIEAHPEAWPEFLGLGPVRVIDSDLSTVTSEVDKVLRVEAAEPWLLHVELQTGYEVAMPRRLWRCNVLLDVRHDLPVRSVVVLLRPQADGPALSGHLRRQLPGGEVHHEFRYGVVRAWRQPVEALLAGPLGTLPLAPVADVAPGDLPAVIRRMGERLAAEAKPEDTATLWTATYVLMGLRYPEDVTTRLLEGVRAMEDSVTYQAIIRKGRAEGRAEGQALGRAEEARRVLLRLGQKRFGPPPEEVVAAIGAIEEPERIEELCDRLLDVASWDELL